MQPADHARPGTIRRRKRELKLARSAYEAARRTFLGHARSKTGPRYLQSREADAAFEAAILARQAAEDAAATLAHSLRIRDEMASGKRDTLGRPKGDG